VVVRNAGPNTATAATVTDTLPAGLSGLTLTSVVTAGGGTLTARTWTSVVFTGTLTLPPNSSVTLNLRAIATNVGVHVNTATVAPPATAIDPNPGNNTGTAAVTVPLPADLRVSKTNGVGTVTSGTTTSYTITVSNLGPNSANGSVLTDPPATGLNCTSVACTAASGGAICPASPTIAQLQGAGIVLPTLPGGSSLSFVVTCGVTASGLP